MNRRHSLDPRFLAASHIRGVLPEPAGDLAPQTPRGGTRPSRITVTVGPNATSLFEAGLWTVELRGDDILDGRFDAWIERDVRDRDNNFADQSFFYGGDFDARMTLGTPATSRRCIAVANYDHHTDSVNPSSSRGRTQDGRAKPELAAPGTAIVSAAAHGGRQDSGGHLIPMRTAMSGTSMSAPHVAGAVALILEEDPELTSAQIRAVLVASARRDHGSSFDEAIGYGILDVPAALALLA